MDKAQFNFFSLLASLLDSLISDRIVVGIRDNGTHKRLLLQSKLILNECININFVDLVKQQWHSFKEIRKTLSLLLTTSKNLSLQKKKKTR